MLPNDDYDGFTAPERADAVGPRFQRIAGVTCACLGLGALIVIAMGFGLWDWGRVIFPCAA